MNHETQRRFAEMAVSAAAAQPALKNIGATGNLTDVAQIFGHLSEAVQFIIDFDLTTLDSGILFQGMGVYAYMSGNRPMAEEWVGRGLSLFQSRGDSKLYQAASMTTLANYYAEWGRNAEALLWANEAIKLVEPYEIGGPIKSICLLNLSLVKHRCGHLSEAEYILLKLIDHQSSSPVNPATLIAATNNLGAIYSDQGRLDEAQSMYAKVLLEMPPTVDTNKFRFLTTQSNLAKLLTKTGEYTKALEQFETTIKQAEAYFGTEHPILGSLLAGLGVAQMKLKNHESAKTSLTLAIKITRRVLGEICPQFAECAIEIGKLNVIRGKITSARRWFQRGLKVLSVMHSGVMLVEPISNLASLEYRVGNFDLALEGYQRIRDIFDLNGGFQTNEYAIVLNNLGQCTLALGLPRDASRLFQQAADLLEPTKEIDRDTYELIVANLANSAG